LIHIEQLSDLEMKKNGKPEIGAFDLTCSNAFLRSVGAQKHTRISIHAEAHDPPKIDVPKVHGADATQQVVLNALTA
jgi:hypothetical protein